MSLGNASHTPATRRALAETHTRLDRAATRLRNDGTHDRLTIALAAGLPRYAADGPVSQPVSIDAARIWAVNH